MEAAVAIVPRRLLFSLLQAETLLPIKVIRATTPIAVAAALGTTVVVKVAEALASTKPRAPHLSHQQQVRSPPPPPHSTIKETQTVLASSTAARTTREAQGVAAA